MSDSKNTPETIADICREMRSKIDCLATDPGYNHIRCRSAEEWAARVEAAKDAEIARLKEKSCEYALPNHGCTAEAKHFHKTVELERKVALLERALKPVMMCAAYCDERGLKCRKEQGKCFVQKWVNALAKAAGEEAAQCKGCFLMTPDYPSDVEAVMAWNKRMSNQERK